MRKLLWVAILFVLVGKAHAATNCAIAAGASEATIQAAGAAASTNSCTGTTNGSTVQLAAGSYSWPSKWNMPCGSSNWTLTGPVVPLTNMTIGGYGYSVVAPTAVINGSVSSDVGFSAPSSCTAGFTLQYFEWNGGRPSGGGGGFGYAGQGASNYTVQYVYAHGFQAVQYQSPNQNEVFWYLDGCALNTCSSPPVASNVSVKWNRIGNSDAGDCSAIMNEYQYVPDNTQNSNYGGNVGGYCGTLGINSYTSNMVVQNNDWFHVEQAGKCYEADGSSPYYAFLQPGFLFQFNDLDQIHRIGFEGQCQPQTSETFDSNSIHDQYYGGYASWPLSLPQSGSQNSSGGGQTNSTNNVIMSNLTIPNVPSSAANCYQYASGATSCYSGSSTGGYFYPAAVEFWGPGTASHNLVQSTITSGIGSVASPGCQVGTGSINYNILQSTNYSGQIYTTPNEQCNTATPPTTNANVVGTTVSAQTSQAPSISVSGNTVSITSYGYLNNTAGPLGNTSAYYTTDGSTPTTASAFCGYSCSFTVANGTTVNAISMWGARNQPKSYASGYGFVPSKVVSAQVAGGSTPTLTGVSLTLQDGTSTLQVGNSKQACANMTYSGGLTTQSCGTGADVYGTTPGTWTSSNTSVASIGNTGSVAGTAAGTTNLTVKAGSYTSAAYPVSVTAAAPVLQSITISCTSSIAVGQAGSCSCTGTYTGPTTGSCPTTSYSSSSPSVATVNSSTGALNGVAVGSTTITGSGGGFSSSVPVSVTSNAPPAATLTSVAVSCSPNYAYVGGTQPCQATATYSDGTNTNCTTTDAHGNLCTGWNSTEANVGTVSSTGVVTAVAPGSTNLTVAAPGGHAVYASNVDDTLTNWKPVCVLPGCNPGGSNTPTATTQTINNASPSLDGESMQISLTTPATSTQTNALWVYLAGSCDSCTNLSSDYYVYPGANASHATSFEYDIFNFDVTDGVDYMWGMQCNFANGYWQIANQTSGWTNTAVACSLPLSTWHHIQVAVHRVPGDTSCAGGVPCQYYDTLIVDGVSHTINMTQPSSTLPSNYASEVGYQFQIDVGATTTAQTVNENIDEAGFSATNALVSPAYSFLVATPPATNILGNNQYNTVGTTYPSNNNSTYAVTASGVSSTVSSCTFYLPTGYTYPAGSKWDCGLILAPSATTQASSWLCHATYTTLGTSADVGWHTVSLTGCGNLPASTGYWVAVNTNESGPIGEGFWNCGGSCTGSPPTSGNGTFPCAYISATYGTYTGMGTAMNPGCGPAGTQSSQYVTLTTPTPTLTGGYLTTPGATNTLQIGRNIQIYAVCTYSNGTSYLCSPNPDTYGDQLTSITSSNPSVATVGAVGSAHPGLLTGISAGATNISATVTGNLNTSSYGETITTSATPLPPMTPRPLSR